MDIVHTLEISIIVHLIPVRNTVKYLMLSFMPACWQECSCGCTKCLRKCCILYCMPVLLNAIFIRVLYVQKALSIFIQGLTAWTRLLNHIVSFYHHNFHDQFRQLIILKISLILPSFKDKLSSFLIMIDHTHYNKSVINIMTHLLDDGGPFWSPIILNAFICICRMGKKCLNILVRPFVLNVF